MKTKVFLFLLVFMAIGQSLCYAEGASVKASSMAAKPDIHGFEEIVFSERAMAYDRGPGGEKKTRRDQAF